MPSGATELFQEYADAYARGERPRARDFLDRADGADVARLEELIDHFLGAVPVGEASVDESALVHAWLGGESPLLELRTRRGLKRADVVGALAAALGLDQTEKLRRRYHELETGQLEPAGIDRRVWEALAETLKARVEELAAWARPARPFERDVAYFRMPASAAPPDLALLRAREPEPDEVDALFGLGPRES